MTRLNVKLKPDFSPHETAAVQAFAPKTELERTVSCCLLGERQFYIDGQDVEARIADLAAKVSPEDVAALAVKARIDLGLRHVPLLLLCALAPRGAGALASNAARSILRTPKDAMDLVALYWKAGKKPLPNAFKVAIRDGFARWTDYQLAKYATLTNVSVRLRDLAFLAHPKPGSREALFTPMANDELRAPDTWEAALSKPGTDKRAEWERLLSERKLGALALVRNLRNMEQVGVNPALVREALANTKAADVWPWQALAAAREVPAYTHDLDALMIRSAGALPRLPGHTGVLVDVSGSMNTSMSQHGTILRMEAAAGLAVVLREVCEEVTIASFSNAVAAIGKPMPRGATLAKAIVDSQPHQGTYLGAAVKAFSEHVLGISRLVVLTDEQSADRAAYPGEAYVINLASYQRGVSWDGPVTRISGWSGGVIRYLAERVAGSVPAASEDETDETTLTPVGARPVQVWCFDCNVETAGLPADWRMIRGVYRCARCAAFDQTRTPEQIRSLVTPPYAELELRRRLFVATP